MTDTQRARLVQEIALLLARVKRLVDELTGADMAEGKIPDAIRLVAQEFDVSPVAMCGRSKVPKLAEARNAAQYVLREALGVSYPLIAEVTGFSHDSNVYHSIRKVDERRLVNPRFDARIRKLIDAVMTGKHRAA